MGGATPDLEGHGSDRAVSIAEAILWGEQHLEAMEVTNKALVSIAEAILWGEQHDDAIGGFVAVLFQSQRRFFGGSNVRTN